ncbi:MAG TPA: hypothetical protein DD723_06230 [Candidatus Omnitrophica bacterium]|nr:MAG: hypothetical protein A2Z81_06550 [Omnitrophica WOR_2 bacterium GWA2_45_18]HBR15122.1 hypothetical protein [Candidatus Omnitrophota bacterium]
MPWFRARLIKGECFPPDVPWPSGIEAYVPLHEDLLKTVAPPTNEIQIYYKRQNSSDLFPLVWIRDGKQEAGLDLTSWIRSLQEETYRPEHTRPLTARLPFHYHRIPGWARNSLAAFLVQWNSSGLKKRPVFPVSLFNGGCEILLGVCRSAWNGGLRLPTLVLTHDIDTFLGFEWVEPMAEIEEVLGLRSSWNVVPRHYPMDEGRLCRLMERGHEIGLHGIRHDNKEAFLSEQVLRGEFHQLKGFMEKFGIKGYRSPSWYRTKTMFKVLGEFFRYDLSCPDNDLICPAGHGGVGFVRPFRRDNGLMELPCTLPFEVPLFSSVKPGDLVDYWREKIDFVHACQGMLLVNTHPDPNYSGNKDMARAYEQLLKYILKREWTRMLPREVSENFKR